MLPLQLVVVRRRGTPWFQRMSNFHMDYREVDVDFITEYYKQLEEPYDMAKGPLWRARLVQPPKDGEAARDREKYPIPPGSRSEAVLIFAGQHGIVDGTTYMVLCQEFLDTLNALLKKQPVSANRYSFISPIGEALQPPSAWVYSLKYFLTKTFNVGIRDFTVTTSFKGALPIPRTTQRKCKSNRKVFPQEVTRQLLERCRASKVTVHACVSAAAKLALLKVAQNRTNSSISPSLINTLNAVNMRRYMSKEQSRSLGCHIAFEECEVEVSFDRDVVDFWGLARRVYDTMQHHLEVDRDPLLATPVYRSAIMGVFINHILTKNGRKNRTDSHLATTNMGNLDRLLPGRGSPVEIINVFRTGLSELAGTPCILTFHTFRGRLQLSVDYFTNKMTDDVAKELFDILGNYLLSLADTGVLVPKEKGSLA